MKRNLKAMVILALVIILPVWIIDKIPFEMDIDMQVEPTIYMDGKFADMTTVTIKGEKTRQLFRDDSFVGEVRIACIEKTSVDGVQAKISWHGNDELQPLSFCYMGDSFGADNYGLTASLMMKEDMRNSAFVTTDGKVISTAHVYYNYLEQEIGT